MVLKTNQKTKGRRRGRQKEQGNRSHKVSEIVLGDYGRDSLMTVG